MTGFTLLVTIKRPICSCEILLIMVPTNPSFCIDNARCSRSGCTWRCRFKRRVVPEHALRIPHRSTCSGTIRRDVALSPGRWALSDISHSDQPILSESLLHSDLRSSMRTRIQHSCLTARLTAVHSLSLHWQIAWNYSLTKFSDLFCYNLLHCYSVTFVHCDFCPHERQESQATAWLPLPSLCEFPGSHRYLIKCALRAICRPMTQKTFQKIPKAFYLSAEDFARSLFLKSYCSR